LLDGQRRFKRDGGHVMKIMESTMRSSHFGGWATAFVGFIFWGESTGAAPLTTQPSLRLASTERIITAATISR
jgi:hypothetical protein